MGEISIRENTLSIRVLIDSDTDDCFVDPDVVEALGCSTERLNESKKVCSLDWRLLSLSSNHVEQRIYFAHAIS